LTEGQERFPWLKHSISRASLIGDIQPSKIRYGGFSPTGRNKVPHNSLQAICQQNRAMRKCPSNRVIFTQLLATCNKTIDAKTSFCESLRNETQFHQPLVKEND